MIDCVRGFSSHWASSSTDSFLRSWWGISGKTIWWIVQCILWNGGVASTKLIYRPHKYLVGIFSFFSSLIGGWSIIYIYRMTNYDLPNPHLIHNLRMRIESLFQHTTSLLLLLLIFLHPVLEEEQVLEGSHSPSITARLWWITSMNSVVWSIIKGNGNHLYDQFWIDIQLPFQSFYFLLFCCPVSFSIEETCLDQSLSRNNSELNYLDIWSNSNLVIYCIVWNCNSQVLQQFSVSKFWVIVVCCSI